MDFISTMVHLEMWTNEGQVWMTVKKNLQKFVKSANFYI